MLQYIATVALTSVVVVSVSEIAKRSTLPGAASALLPFFLVLPSLLKSGWGFWPSMRLASFASVIAYAGMTYCLNRLGIVG
jgi:hypothetical protein